MAGIFRYTPASSTPVKKTSSFFGETSGQDTSTESCLSFFKARSPSVGTLGNQVASPRCGRSVREFEEQMTTLKKENFNLKLRIYFLEELFPPGSTNTTIDAQAQENFLKQNIDLKVDLELVRQEVKEKQAVLCDAARAIEIMENELKESQTKNEEIIQDLNKKIDQLETQIKAGGSQLLNIGEITKADITVQEKIQELQEAVKAHLKTIEDVRATNNSLLNEISQKESKIAELGERIKKLIFENAELHEELSEVKSNGLSEYVSLEKKYSDCKAELEDKSKALLEIDAKLREKIAANESANETIQRLLLNINHLQDEIDKIKEMHSPLKLQIARQESINIVPDTAIHSEDHIIDILKIKIAQVIEEKNVHIHKLDVEMKRNSAFFQKFIHKMLWDKHREIERLSKLLSQYPTSPLRDFLSRQSLTEIEFHEYVEYDKHLQRRIDHLFEQLYDFDEGSTSPLVLRLKEELQETRDELNKANIWRQECTEVCASLTLRLHEVAGFLDSLLKHKDILGALAADRRRAIRRAIDRSLDLSRSWNNMTSFGSHTLGSFSSFFDQTTDSKENQPMHFLDSSILSQTHVIEKLKAEVKSLKKELGRRRSTEHTRRERRSNTTFVDNRSESETWSEPDRNVSMARMGLEDPITISSIRNTRLETENTSTDTEHGISRRSRSRIVERSNQVEALLSQHENQILQIQCELVEADNRLKKESFKAAELSQELDQYKRVNEMLENEIANFKLRPNGASCMDQIDKLVEERDKLTAELHLKEMQLEGLKEEMKALKEAFERKISEVREEETYKASQLEKELLKNFEDRFKEQERRHRDSIGRDYVVRKMFDDVNYELNQAKKKLYDNEIIIEILQETEKELNEQLLVNEKSMRDLKKSLDGAALQASKAVLERTKALSEKFMMEQKLRNVTEKLDKVEKDKFEILNKLQQMNLNHRHSPVECGSIKKQSSNGSDISGYTSEDVPAGCTGLPRFDNLSPDLGIESDAGRTSSVETLIKTSNLIRAVEISQSNALREVTEGLSKLSLKTYESDALNNNNQTVLHDCEKVEEENSDLKKKLVRTKRSLEDTWCKLRAANQRKEQVERDIRQQILKTQNVLRNVRTSMENEMEQHKIES